MDDTEILIAALEDRVHERIEVLSEGQILRGPGGTRLVCAHADQQRIEKWIDRRSRFGNPFTTEGDGGGYTRAESVENYRVWFEGALRSDHGPFDEDDVERLRGRVLGCWCLPRLCHGVVIMNHLAETYDPQQTLQEVGADGR